MCSRERISEYIYIFQPNLGDIVKSSAAYLSGVVCSCHCTSRNYVEEWELEPTLAIYSGESPATSSSSRLLSQQVCLAVIAPFKLDWGFLLFWGNFVGICIMFKLIEGKQSLTTCIFWLALYSSVYLMIMIWTPKATLKRGILCPTHWKCFVIRFDYGRDTERRKLQNT